MFRPIFLFIISDILALFIAIFAAFWIRFQSQWIPIKEYQPITFYLFSFLTVTPLYLFLMYALGNYQERRGKLSQYEIQNVQRSLMLFYMVCFGITFFLHIMEHSRLMVILTCLTNVMLCLVFRQFIVKWQMRRWEQGRGTVNVFILGKNEELMEELGSYLKDHPQLGYRLSGKALIENKLQLSRVTDFERVILTGDVSYAEISDVILSVPQNVRVDYMPSYHVLLDSFPFKDQIGPFHLLPLSRQVFLDWQSVTKRMIDVSISAILLFVLSPILLLIFLSIWICYGRPILFRQQRVGQNGLLFMLYKFRTMKPDSEREISDWIASSKQTIFKKKNDPRVEGTFAWFLRRTGLDELPQLWNVLCGNMSLVGPRPATVELVKNYSAEHKLRLSVPPGITGLQQAYCRGSDSMEEILKYDFQYVREKSIWLDLVIILRTLKTVLWGKGVS